jgi:prepilin-type N-terminal cleavage/methylation domain-containing protein
VAKTPGTTAYARPQRGFTLVELLISMVIVLIVTGGALTAFSYALRASDTIKEKLDLNDQIRIATDLMVRDFIQVAQGLPDTKVISVPSGGMTTQIKRPSPLNQTYLFPAGKTELNAVTTGDGLGPTVRSIATDVVSIVYADNLPCNGCPDAFAAAAGTVAANGQTVTITDATRPVFNVLDSVKSGDLLMFTASGGTAIQMVTSTPTSQAIAFSGNDPMNLNQQGSPAGTILRLDNDFVSATNTFPVGVTRIRMVSYYIDNTTDPTLPRLIRQINMNPGRVVAFGIENLQFAYDLVDGVTNPTNVANPATPNQIRKVDIALEARSRTRSKQSGDFFRASLATQVSFRNMALVDRYR